MNVPILLYHQITDTPPAGYTRYTVTRAQFTRQMRWLRLRGYTAVSLDALMACRAGEQPWPTRAVVITIDDGYAEAVEHAADVLPRFGFTATVFLVAGVMGRTSNWDAGVTMPIVGWNRARALMDSGLSFGSHSVTHPRLALLDPDACARELIERRAKLEDGLGANVVHLAYPYGSMNEAVRRIAAEAGYVTGCGVTLELATPRDNPFELPRVLVVSADSIADFACRLRTARPLGEMVRARFNRTLNSMRSQ
jgi:peptidoglycan/xylan/chitin deacetylase (PgdA/CDA1 family)